MTRRSIRLLATILLISAMGLISCASDESSDPWSAQRATTLTIRVQDQEVATVDFSRLESLPFSEFEATLRTSGGTERNHTFGGIQVQDLLGDLDLNLHEFEQLTAEASDGYAVAFNMEEVLASDNVYVAYVMDGEAMRSEEEEGPGPYQLIVRSDQFGQRWIKFLVALELE